MKKTRNNSGIEKYLNKPKTFKVLGLSITPKPLKLRWKLLTANITERVRRFTIKEAGLTPEEVKDTAYTGLLQVYENLFFSLSHKPKNEPSGVDNLVEILSACASEDIDWNKFIKDKLKGKTPDKQIEIYNEIRTAGMALYKDFFTEILTLRRM